MTSTPKAFGIPIGALPPSRKLSGPQGGLEEADIEYFVKYLWKTKLTIIADFKSPLGDLGVDFKGGLNKE